MSATCEVEGCGRSPIAQGLCWGHVKQRQRGVPLRPLLGRPTTVEGANLLVRCAAISYANTRPEPEEDEAAAFAELLRAVEVRRQIVLALQAAEAVQGSVVAGGDGKERP